MIIGIFSSLFRQRKPKSFLYKPLYYSAEKEAREKRIALVKKEIGSETHLQNGELKKLLREKWRKNFISHANKKSNVRIIIIASLLSVICYLLLR